MSITTRTPAIITIQKTIGANQEAEDHIEVKMLVGHSDHKITIVEAKKATPSFKVVIMVMMIIEAIIKGIKLSSQIHKGDITQVTDIARLVVEAMDVVEEISVHADMAGPILEAIIIINTSNIIPTRKIKQWNNMALPAVYVVVAITLPNIVTRESMTLTTSWKK